MSSAPSFASPNRFAILYNESDNISHERDETIDAPPIPSDIPAVPEPEPAAPVRPPLPWDRLRRKAAWERKLPKRYTIAATPSANSLHLPLEIESTDTAVKLVLDGLVDCGATSDFIDSEYVAANNVPVRRLAQPIPVYNVDGSPNEAGSIREVADVIVRYRNHSERAVLAVTRLGKQKLILGFSWLRKHNPEIDWETREVKMSRCPAACTTCRDEARTERQHARTAASLLRQLRAGPVPRICTIDTDERSGEDDDLEFDEELPGTLSGYLRRVRRRG